MGFFSPVIPGKGVPEFFSVYIPPYLFPVIEWEEPPL
jgi:hypothetical protein